MTLKIEGNNNAETQTWEIKLAGEIDISNAQQLKTQIETSTAEAKQNVSIDLAELTYIDSTGLGVIIAAHSQLKKDGFWVKVHGATGSVKRLLTVSNLDKILG